MAEDIDYVFRDHVTPGNPASGEAKPEKSRIRRLLKEIAGGTAAVGDFRGAWDSGTAYIATDLVEDGGSIWYALADSAAVTPVEGATWTLFLPGVSVADGTVTNAKVTSTATDPLRVAISAVSKYSPEYYGAMDDTGGADCSTAINAGMVAVKELRLPPGTFNVGPGLSVANSKRRLVGAGRQKTILKGSTTNTPVISVVNGTINTEICGMTLDRSATAAAGASGIKVTTYANLMEIFDIEITKQFRGLDLCSTGFSTIRDFYIHRNLSHGIYMTNTPTPAAPSTLQWYVREGLLEANDGWGSLAVATADVEDIEMGEFSGVKTYANTGGGLGFEGLPGTRIHGVRIYNGFIGGDNFSEIYLNTYGYGHKISGTYVELAGKVDTGSAVATPPSGTGCGIDVTINNLEVEISNVTALGNSEPGIRSLATEFTTILGGSSRGNTVGIAIGDGALASITATRFALNTVDDIFANSNEDKLQFIGVTPVTLGNRFAGGVAVGSPTGGVPGAGIVNVDTAYLTDGV